MHDQAHRHRKRFLGSRARVLIRSSAPWRRPRWGTLALVILLHLAALAALMRAFAPDFTADAIERAASLVTVTITAPPEPEPTPAPQPDHGAAGEEGRQAIAPAPAVPLARPSPAPANSSDAGDQGAGTGTGGEGEGSGSGTSGSGAGGGSRPLEKIAGDIASARDFPRVGREARKGHDVVIELAVDTDGRVAGCRVTDPSPDPEADAITCRLATQRFVFRPRLNADGVPVVGTYRWRQRWF